MRSGHRLDKSRKDRVSLLRRILRTRSRRVHSNAIRPSRRRCLAPNLRRRRRRQGPIPDRSCRPRCRSCLRRGLAPTLRCRRGRQARPELNLRALEAGPFGADVPLVLAAACGCCLCRGGSHRRDPTHRDCCRCRCRCHDQNCCPDRNASGLDLRRASVADPPSRRKATRTPTPAVRRGVNRATVSPASGKDEKTLSSMHCCTRQPCMADPSDERAKFVADPAIFPRRKCAIGQLLCPTVATTR